MALTQPPPFRADCADCRNRRRRAAWLWFAGHVRAILKITAVRVTLCVGLAVLVMYWSLPSPTLWEMRRKAI
jgi:hypothetical protein